MAAKKSSTSCRLIKTNVEALPIPATGHAVWWDDQLTGFGVRISDRGTRTYFVQGRLPDGRQVKTKVGRHGTMTAEQARGRAKHLLGAMQAGNDPAADRRAARQAEKERRQAPTIADLLERYMTEHAEHRKRPRSIQTDRSLINKHLQPELGARKVAEITHADVEKLHRQIGTTAPIAANRAVALLSKAFSLSIKWGWRPDNPCKGLERNSEERRERYLTPVEVARLCTALNKRHKDLAAATIAFLMVTGARRNEALNARWRDFDPSAGVWAKPASTTKQRKLHRVPLSGAARAMLAQLAERYAPDEPPADAYVFGGPEMINRLRSTWGAVRDEAKLPGLRLHDLRHAFASLLASAGLSLPVIGALLGHSTPVTTSRYSHLLDDPLRVATEKVGGLWQELSNGGGYA